jgi:hypothetical protein
MVMLMLMLKLMVMIILQQFHSMHAIKTERRRRDTNFPILFVDRRQGLVVTSTPWPLNTPSLLRVKDLFRITQEAGWALEPIWTGMPPLGFELRTYQAEANCYTDYPIQVQHYQHNSSSNTTTTTTTTTTNKKHSHVYYLNATLINNKNNNRQRIELDSFL